MAKVAAGSVYQRLVDNDQDKRHAAMRELRDSITANPDITAKEMRKVWEGLYFCYWMSDKEEIQHELSRALASSMFLWSPEVAVLYFEACINAIGDRWGTIDQHRMDKYLALLRRHLEAMFILLRVHDWELRAVEMFHLVFSRFLQQATLAPRGACIHLISIYFESWARSFQKDVFFNDLDIDEEQTVTKKRRRKYDDNTDVEEIFYQQYMDRRKAQFSAAAQENARARKLAKQKGIQGPARLKQPEKPQFTKEGLLIHRSPLGFLLNCKRKYEITIDTPQIAPAVVQKSRDVDLFMPPEPLLILFDIPLNLYKITSDPTIRSTLVDNFDVKFFDMLTRFKQDMIAERDQDEEYSPQSTPYDALIPIFSAYLDIIIDFLNSKAQNEHLQYQFKHPEALPEALANQIGKKNGEKALKKYLSSLITQREATTRTVKGYLGFATRIRKFLDDLRASGLAEDDDGDEDHEFDEDNEFDNFDEDDFDEDDFDEDDEAFYGEMDEFDTSAIYGEGETDGYDPLEDEYFSQLNGMGEGEAENELDLSDFDFGEGEFSEEDKLAILQQYLSLDPSDDDDDDE